MTQENSILKDLLRGCSITPLDALKKYGCFRLSARIYNLRAEGYNIQMVWVQKNGKKFAKYFIKEKEYAIKKGIVKKSNRRKHK